MYLFVFLCSEVFSPSLSCLEDAFVRRLITAAWRFLKMGWERQFWAWASERQEIWEKERFVFLARSAGCEDERGKGVPAPGWCVPRAGAAPRSETPHSTRQTPLLRARGALSLRTRLLCRLVFSYKTDPDAHLALEDRVQPPNAMRSSIQLSKSLICVVWKL